MKAIDWPEEQRSAWNEWVATRPECIQKMCVSHPPDEIYKMKSTDQVVTIASYFEDGTVKVDISNDRVLQVLVERQVFDIPIDDLEIWDGKTR